MTDSQPQATSRRVGGIVIVIVALLVLGVVVFTLTRGGGEGTPPASTEATTEPAAPTGSAGDRNPDAGTIETDGVGRQVIVPANRGGDVLSTTPDDGGTCESVRSPAGLQIQRINMYPVLFSTDAGPTQVVNSTPVGYASGPRGAVLAGINSYMLMSSGGTPGREMLINHMVIDEAKRESARAELKEGFNTEPSYQQAALAFRVRSCTDKAVVVDYALPQMGDERAPFPEPKWRVVSILVVKDGGEWKMSLRGDTFQDRGLTENKDGFIEWDL